MTGPKACQSFTIRWMSLGPHWAFAKAPNNANAGWETDWAAAAFDKNKLATNNRNGFHAAYQPVVGYFTTAQAQGLGATPNPLTLPAC